MFIDTCLVNNGGCDANADCSHDTNTNQIKCTCKTGYTFGGAGSNAVCTGNQQKMNIHISSHMMFIDACEVNNGGCDANAVCSHDAKTNAAKCTCKTGYTNVGSASNVICKGKTISTVENTKI